MHTIKLQVQDGIYSHIMFFLKNLNTQDLKILEDKEVNTAYMPEKADNVKAFSNHSANLIDEWKEVSEDDVWK